MALARHTMDDGEGLRLRVATFNVRNTTDRYAERRPMLVDALRGFRAALVGLQEVSFQVSVPGVAHGGSQAVALLAEAIGEEVGSEYAQGVAPGAGAAGHGTGEASGDTAVATAGATSPDGVDHPKPVADGGVGAPSDGGGDAGTSAGTGAGAGAGAGGDRSGEVAGAGNHAAKSARAATVYHAATKTPFPQPAGNPTFRIDGNALYVQVEAPHTVTRHEALVLSEVRSAHRVLLTLPGGDGAAAGGCTRVWFANTHLHHEVGDDAHARLRLQQSEAVCKWMAPCVAAGDIVVIVGDFNAPPAEPACVARHTRPPPPPAACFACVLYVTPMRAREWQV